MRFTQLGMLVKSIDVPLVEATAVPLVIMLPAGVTKVALVKVALVKVGEVKAKLEAKYVLPTLPAVAGMALSTELT
jgi:hypothetical protein